MSVPLWVQGAINGGGNVPSITVSLTGTVVGNALVLSWGGCRGLFIDTSHSFPTVSDTAGNVWLPVCMSPPANDGMGVIDYQLYTFIALNCLGGDTDITVTAYTNGGDMVASVDEYSNVAAVRAIGQKAYQSTVFGSGATSVDTGSVTINANEILYSAAYCPGSPFTFTPTSGFIQRQYGTGAASIGLSAASFDYSPGAGAYSNTVAVSPTPTTLHATLVALSSVAVATPIVQLICGAATSISGTGLAITFPYSNTSGNALILVALMVERTNATVTDTLGNTWVVVYDDTSLENDTYVLAYCLNCKGGANTVTLSTAAGGTDVEFLGILAEYSPLGAFITSSRGSLLSPVSTADTGFIVAPVPALLISSFNETSTVFGPPAQLQTQRFQLTDSGLFRQRKNGIVLCDTTISVPGSYNNLFDITPSSGSLIAGILGFILNPTPPVGSSTRCVDVPLSGVMSTLEVTRDLDADWDDSSTFIITQDDPFPFTLRGLVMRMSYNPD